MAQVLAHTVFLQDILGYESLSAGLWFVCISFQLGIVYAIMLWIRDALAGRLGIASTSWWIDVPLLGGMAIAVSSLFFFNLDERWSVWWIYFFSQFFLGVLAYEALHSSFGKRWFMALVLLMSLAIALHWRLHLVTALSVGLVLFISGKGRAWERGSASRTVRYLGRISYSFFLIHFPVLVLVATLWAGFELDSPAQILWGFGLTYVVSILAAGAFYRLVEAPADRLSRSFA